MPRWPLLLPPLAVYRHRARVVPCRPLSSSHHCAVSCRQFAVTVAPSLAVAPCPPSPSICHPAVHLRPSPLCSRSITAALAPSLANKEPSRCPSPSRSRCAVHCCCCRGAIVPSLALEEPSCHPLPSRSRCTIHCRRR